MSTVRTASLLVAAAGLALAAFAWSSFQDRVEIIRKWKPVQARVIRSWMTQREESGADGKNTFFQANYEFAYSFDGKPFRSTAFSEDMPLATQQGVLRKLYRHPAGTSGTVYVNPDEPEQIRLNLGFNAYTMVVPLWAGLAAALLLMLGISLWFIGMPAVFW